MPEFIPIELQQSAVVLAETLNFSVAAQILGTSLTTLRTQIRQLSTSLECSLFREDGDSVEVTEEGRVLIDAFRHFLAQRRRL